MHSLKEAVMTGIRVSPFLLNKVLKASSTQRIFKRYIVTKKLINGDKSMVVQVRHMMDKDIPQITELRKKDDFCDPVSLYTMCMEIDPTSIVVVDDGQGKVIGVISVFKDIENLCVAGLRTVHEDYRLLGLSSKVLLPKGLALGGNRTMITTSIIGELHYAQKRLPYLTKSFMVIEYDTKGNIFPERLSSHVPQGVEIKKFDDSHFASLLEFDHLASGFKREATVKRFCHDPHGETVTAFRDDKCVGYGIIKLDIVGRKKVGPLYAESPEIAEALLKQLLESFKSGTGFHGSAPSNNASASSMFEKLGNMNKLNVYRLCGKDIAWPGYENVYSLFEIEIEPI